ncbi:MAG: alpha-2-macroglobulin [Dehalococcoidia bacterium]|nr:MAG: alpha-2-macroglobulin [Dehalococcoidia bacterium]
MRSVGLLAVVAVLIVALLGSMLPGCTDVAQAVESYVIVAPKSLQVGGQEAVSVALFGEDGLTSGSVTVALLKDGERVLHASEHINGKGTLKFEVPDIEAGAYEIRVTGNGFEDSAQVRVERSSLVFMETDKPIYKPGQTIHMRAITLNPDLRPESESVTVDVLDAKGIKIFRQELNTDEYGIATLDLPISNEPNLGGWKITATSENGETQLDVKVEEYVLPKYEVKTELPREWFLVTDPITGSVFAEYSFGKPVKGELVIKASRYVGEWEEYATLTKDIDGETVFELPAVGYVAGVPAAGGLGNVMLDISVTEDGTGYKESTSELLTVSDSALNIQLIPESLIFKPGLPFSLLIVTETPDNEPVDANIDVKIAYLDEDLEEVSNDTRQVTTGNGIALLQVTPPGKAVVMIVDCFELTPVSSVPPARVSRAIEAGYSPTGNFIHVEQESEGVPQIGEEIVFKVNSTKEAANFYYEIVSRDTVVFTDYTSNDRISFVTTPQMAPSAKLLVYQILPNSEVAADYLPFEVQAEYPHEVSVGFSTEEGRPGEVVMINVQTEGSSKVGIVAVDRSVFILAENRLNLQQVFDELERLYMEPQVELHEFTVFGGVNVRGAQDIFEDAGVVVLSNMEVPEGKQYQSGGMWLRGGGDVVMFAMPEAMEDGAMPPPMPMGPGELAQGAKSVALAEVERVRQYFPETWLWEEIITDAGGNGSLQVEVPDTITTWMLRAVALSQERGIGIAEAQLVAFQPFFLKADLPYSAIRGEEFPLKVAVYNYLDESQDVFVQLDEGDWFDLLDESEKMVSIAANDVGGVEFMISPKELGINEVKVTARSTEAADAVIKTLIVEPEGIAREIVENLVLSAGSNEVVSTQIPALVVVDSGRAYIAVTSSYLSQTLEGLEGLIQMPFGCGEQNMIVFAPDVFITKYLEESGQLKPEIMAKAEKLMITGYQRELTYRHRDGSFSAFGDSDPEGSLWLTAFVLKCFAQAEDLIYIDDSILDEATDWIVSHQNADGSFDTVGFVAHEEMMGGVQGRNALTAYVAIALLEAGEQAASAAAIDFLEDELNGIDDAYTTAIVTYALELAGSQLADEAHEKLMDLAQEDENGLHWGDVIEPLPWEEGEQIMPRHAIMPNKSIAIEATGYATLALIQHDDAFNASRAAKWLVSQRNAYGGYGSTQDTVVALQALTEYSSDARADVDLTISIVAGGEEQELRITQENFDVLQIIEVPVNEDIEISVEGEGEAIAQVVERFNIPEAEPQIQEILKIDVDYDTTQVEVNDLVEVSVELEFNPPIEMEAGMVVVDVSVPTGFAPVTDSIEQVVDRDEQIKRYDVAGRKVIFYIENMLPGDVVSFSFDVVALYPVKAKAVASQAYSYYKPEIRGVTLGQEMVVS